MGNYNLTDNVQDKFEFVLYEKKYEMRYPNTEEIEKIQEVTTELSQAEDEKRNDDVKSIGKQLEAMLYDFITPVEHETPLAEVMKKANIKVIKNFNTMIKTELAIQ